MRGHDGEGRRRAVRRNGRRDLGRRRARNVAGHGHHGRVALAHKQARRRRDGAGVAVPRAVCDNARAMAEAKRGRGGIDRDHNEAGKLPDRAQRPEHILEHGRRKHAAFFRAQGRRQPLLGALEFLDRHDGPDSAHAATPRPRFDDASASAASSTTRASRSFSARLVMSVGASVTFAAT